MRIDRLQGRRNLTFVLTGIRPHLEIFHHRQILKNFAPFGHVGDAEAHDLFWGDAVNTLAHELNRASRRWRDTRDRLECRGLPSTIRPEESDDAPFWHVQGDAFEGTDVAVERLNTVNLQQRSLPPPDRLR